VSIDTTFSMFVQLLKDSIDANDDLSDSMKVALKVRADALPRIQDVELTSRNVSASSNATVDIPNDKITVADGDSGYVEFNLETFDTPVRIEGTIGTIGALLGHVGQGVNPAVAEADLVMKYRLATSDAWRAFGRNVVVDEATQVQFRVEIDTQTGDHDLPQIHVIAEQL